MALSILGKCASEKEDNQAANTVSNEAHNDVKISNVGGNADAQNMLGELAEMGLYSGIESKADYATAAYWYRKAIQQGHHRAMFNMGAMYERGLHVEHDIEQAIRFYNEVHIINDSLQSKGTKTQYKGLST